LFNETAADFDGVNPYTLKEESTIQVLCFFSVFP